MTRYNKDNNVLDKFQKLQESESESLYLLINIILLYYFCIFEINSIYTIKLCFFLSYNMKQTE